MKILLAMTITFNHKIDQNYPQLMEYIQRKSPPGTQLTILYTEEFNKWSPKQKRKYLLSFKPDLVYFMEITHQS